MSGKDARYVYLAPAGNRERSIYHTNEECHLLPDRTMAYPLDSLNGFRECKACSNTNWVDKDGAGNRGHFNALLNHDQD